MDGAHFCAHREVSAGIEGGVDSSAMIQKANATTNRQGHLNDRLYISLECLDYILYCD